MLTDGDMTKLSWIRENVTIQSMKPYLERQVEKKMMNDAILSYIGIKIPR